MDQCYNSFQPRQSAEEAADDSEKRNENTGCHTEILQLWDGLLDYIMPEAFSISEGHEIVFSMSLHEGALSCDKSCKRHKQSHQGRIHPLKAPQTWTMFLKPLGDGSHTVSQNSNGRKGKNLRANILMVMTWQPFSYSWRHSEIQRNSTKLNGHEDLNEHQNCTLLPN